MPYPQMAVNVIVCHLLLIKSSPSHNRQEKYTTDSISPSRGDAMAYHANDSATPISH
ncbi:hypothetical protein [Providencia manganoxydans]|uniref:hypothetical protein n=1 Tax=Providencia manganoxydans TaxID=2923283 RepID=UPI0034E3C3E6